MTKRQATTTIMPSVVTVKIGTRLQFNPYTGPSDTDNSWYRGRAKQYVRIIAFDEKDAEYVYVRFEKDGFVTENSYWLKFFILPKPRLRERIRNFFATVLA